MILYRERLNAQGVAASPREVVERFGPAENAFMATDLADETGYLFTLRTVYHRDRYVEASATVQTLRDPDEDEPEAPSQDLGGGRYSLDLSAYRDGWLRLEVNFGQGWMDGLVTFAPSYGEPVDLSSRGSPSRYFASDEGGTVRGRIRYMMNGGGSKVVWRGSGEHDNTGPGDDGHPGDPTTTVDRRRSAGGDAWWIEAASTPALPHDGGEFATAEVYVLDEYNVWYPFEFVEDGQTYKVTHQGFDGVDSYGYAWSWTAHLYHSARTMSDYTISGEDDLAGEGDAPTDTGDEDGDGDRDERLSKPTIVGVEPLSPRSARVTYRDNATNEEGIELERSRDGESWQRVHVGPASGEGVPRTRQFYDGTLEPGVEYQYRARAFKHSRTDEPADNDGPPPPPDAPDSAYLHALEFTGWSGTGAGRTHYEAGIWSESPVMLEGTSRPHAFGLFRVGEAAGPGVEVTLGLDGSTAGLGLDYTLGGVQASQPPGGMPTATATIGRPLTFVGLTALSDTVGDLREYVNARVMPPASTAAGSTSYAPAAPSSAKVMIAGIDLDVDSDNTNGAAVPDHSTTEEGLEDDAQAPGKIVSVNDDDTDKDTILDYLDFDGIDDEMFIPVVFDWVTTAVGAGATLTFEYQGLDKLTTALGTTVPDLANLGSAGDVLRLWKWDGSRARSPAGVEAGGAHVRPHRAYTFGELGAASGRLTLFVEAAAASSGASIKASLDPDGPSQPGVVATDTVRLTPLDLGLSVGTVTTGGSHATFDKPYRFWLNDDHDPHSGLDADDLPVDGSHPFDAGDSTIANIRDLEDFNLFQVFSSYGDLQRLGPGFSLRLAFTDVDEELGQPAIRVYRSQGLNYIGDESQAEQTRAHANGSDIWYVNASGAEIPIQSFAPYMLSEYLFEARSRGQGKLTLQLMHAGKVVADGGSYLDLRPITEMYDHYTVGDTTTMNWDQIPLSAAKIQSAVPDPAAPDDPAYVMFVHGWRMKPEERRFFAETGYKRLFWQGYKGGYGLFSWPTEWNSGTYWAHATDPQNYVKSERKAYRSAAGLRQVLADVNAAHPGKVNVYAHSMGNIVVSEALRQEAASGNPTKIVATYVASQSATVANAFDATVPMHETDESTDTPEVYASYPPTGRPYFERVGLAADKLVNFYNGSDYATASPWAASQDAKPNPSWGYDAVQGFYRTAYDDPFTRQPLSFPADRYEIFAHIAEARSLPLGRQPNVGGPFSTSDQLDLDAQFGFGGAADASHSAQFLSTNMLRGPYWAALRNVFAE